MQMPYQLFALQLQLAFSAFGVNEGLNTPKATVAAIAIFNNVIIDRAGA